MQQLSRFVCLKRKIHIYMNKKTISRTIILLVILLLCSAIGTFYYVKLELQEKNGKTNLFSLIPEDCEAIIEVNNIHSLFQNLHYTAFSESYKGLQISDLINLLDKKFNYLDEQKAHGLSGQMNHGEFCRPSYIRTSGQ